MPASSMSIIKLFTIALCLLAFTACSKKDTDAPPMPTDPGQRANRWILDSMKHYYLWSENIDENTALNGVPADFFNSLLHSNDRFSSMLDGTGSTRKPSVYELFGLHFVFAIVPEFHPQYQLGIVVYVAPGSAAAAAGIKRGTCFSKINNQQTTEASMASQVQLMKQQQVTLTLSGNASGSWADLKDVKLTARSFEERPITERRLFEHQGKITSYVFCNHFDERFDKEIVDAFAGLKTRHVNELIIDLRYNSGGAINTVAKLFPLLKNNLSPTAVFAKYQGNKTFGNISQELERAIELSGNTYGRSLQELKGKGLNLSRVFIITGQSTASAAELLVNNLKPYIQVVQIGERTFGKDQATYAITDKRSPREYPYVLQPVVFNLLNANGEGGYSNGLEPSIKISEYSTLPIAELGSAQDPLVKSALNIIYGNDVPEEVPLRARQLKRSNMQSLSYRSFNDVQRIMAPELSAMP
jgi:carboxyl-terminal processing protease